MSATEMLVPAERGVAAAFTADGMRQALAQRFHDAGLESPSADARILVGHALGLDHTALAAAGDRPISVKESEAIAALARRRLAREPVARIVGSKEFWSLTLSINASTLVPRPETETVVEVALAAADVNDQHRSVDDGAGERSPAWHYQSRICGLRRCVSAALLVRLDCIQSALHRFRRIRRPRSRSAHVRPAIGARRRTGRT